MAGDLVVPAAIRALRAVVRKGIAVIRDRLPQAGHDIASLEPALARNSQRLQQPVARIRQQQQQQASNAHRNYTSNFTRYYTTAQRNSSDASKRPVRSAISKVTKTSPFASTLRPKLCGALPRTVNGYSIGGNARYFSHTTAPAQVVQQVSQAMRAFVLSGKDMSYYAAQRRNTNTYAKGQIKMHLAAANTDRLAPGAYIDFHITPQFTCMSPTDPVGYTCLDGSRGGFMDELNDDIQKVMKDIAIVYQDLRKLSMLGELPITLVEKGTLRVHFRGCDAQLVNSLCDEVGVFSGVIHEDERFAYDRLIPDQGSGGVNWKEMMSSDEDEGYTDWERYSLSDGELQQLDKELSNDMKSAHWEESAEEGYDEIDPGGEYSSSEGNLGCKADQLLMDSAGFVNPWVMPVPDRTGVF